ncbi:MAG: hypothetical protein OIF50_11250 [Flavobacteriaceae bacterium]|nr:hypothetical protein [Flavobacteriaceae bacterium]
MIVKYKFWLLWCVVLLISCNTQESNRNSLQVMSYTIDKFSIPIPPPPPVNSSIIEVPQAVIDSLFAVRFRVAVLETFLDFTEKDWSLVPQNFRDCTLATNPKEFVLKVPKRMSKRHQVSFQQKPFDYEQIDMSYTFSRFYFNASYSKVVYWVTFNRDPYNGNALLFGLEKVNGKWQKVFSERRY